MSKLKKYVQERRERIKILQKKNPDKLLIKHVISRHRMTGHLGISFIDYYGRFHILYCNEN